MMHPPSPSHALGKDDGEGVKLDVELRVQGIELRADQHPGCVDAQSRHGVGNAQPEHSIDEVRVRRWTKVELPAAD